MQTMTHMNRTTTLFPINELTHYHVITSRGERILNMFYSAVRKRKRAEYFKRVERRKQRAKEQSDKIVQGVPGSG